MKHKKIIGLLLFICIAVTCLGIVSATETLDGIEFNIPDGYKLESNQSDTPIEGVTHSEYFFKNGNKNITIEVMTKEDSAISIKTEFVDNAPKTIKGYEGNYSQKTNSFTYDKGEQHVVIAAHDAKLEDIII